MAVLDVLIPHYNDVTGLERSLKSVAGQNWKGDLRVLVADDGSPRDQLARLERLLSDVPFPVTLLSEAQNRGRPYTRNKLLDHVEAPYVAWLDAGDLWLEKKLAVQFEHISRLLYRGENIEDCWVTCDYNWRWESSRSRYRHQNVAQDQLKGLLMGDDLRGYLWTILAPASTFERVGRFDEQLPRLQDLDYFLRFVRAGGRLVKPPGNKKPLCVYEKSDVGRNAMEIRQCNARVFAKHVDSFNAYGPRFLRMRLCKAELLSSRFAKNNQDTWMLCWFLLRAFMTHPLFFIREMRRGL